MVERKDLSVGMKVRNLKTRLVGEVKDFTAADVAVILYEGQAAPFATRLGDIEVLALDEFALVKKLVKLKTKKKDLSDALALVTSEHAAAEDEIYDWLLKHDQESTKVYEGYGRVSIAGTSPKASITEENKEKAFEWLREIGRSEIIKPTIHPATLNAFVDEFLRNPIEGVKELPKFIGYVLKPKISVTKK